VLREILAAKLRREITAEEALRYSIDIGVALSRAHEQGIRAWQGFPLN
jgi:hypothetical protein